MMKKGHLSYFEKVDFSFIWILDVNNIILTSIIMTLAHNFPSIYE